MHEGFLVYAGFRYLRYASLLVQIAIGFYVADNPIDEPNGGTWLGYGLGGIGAALILWLMWFGVRKRRYGGKFNLRAWLSAHVYLGLSLIVIGTLHTGFQFGWNLHTLAYTLMMIVIVSGIFGIYAYSRYPEIAELDRECKQVAQSMPDEVTRLVLQSSSDTRLGGGTWRQLSGRDPSCGTTRAFEALQALGSSAAPGQGSELLKLRMLMQKKVNLLGTVRRDIQLKALMEVWLYFHVPLSIALVASLVAHVLSVFYYW
jgi:hypothetical protein